MGLSGVILRGKSSWISIIGSTVTEGCLHAEQVTVDVKAPANVWSVRQLEAEEGLWGRTGYTAAARHLSLGSCVNLI
jgi:hypothetical protein